MKAYTPQELREKIASNDYGAELCLQHAMLCIDQLSRDAERYRWWKARILAYECVPPSVIFAWPAGVAFRCDDVDVSTDAAMAAEPAVGAV